MQRVDALLGKAKKQLSKTSDTPSLDAELLMADVLKWERYQLITKGDYVLNTEEYKTFNHYMLRRQEHEPIAYIIEKKHFMDLEFNIKKGVLIPRPETEILVTQIMQFYQYQPAYGLEIGVGSGAVLISLLKYCTALNMVGVDISDIALTVALNNAKNQAVYDRIKLIKSDIYSNVKTGEFDFIVSNPPYIETNVLETLEANVVDYEPKLALDGGDDGLVFYREIIKRATYFLKDSGGLFLEIGYNQAEQVSQLMVDHHFINIRVVDDFAGLHRVVYGFKGEIK